MIAKLEFNLPEQREEFDVALDAWKYYGALRDMRSHLLELRKADTELKAGDIFIKFTEILSNNNVILD